MSAKIVKIYSKHGNFVDIDIINKILSTFADDSIPKKLTEGFLKEELGHLFLVDELNKYITFSSTNLATTLCTIRYKLLTFNLNIVRKKNLIFIERFEYIPNFINDFIITLNDALHMYVKFKIHTGVSKILHIILRKDFNGIFRNELQSKINIGPVAFKNSILSAQEFISKFKIKLILNKEDKYILESLSNEQKSEPEIITFKEVSDVDTEYRGKINESSEINSDDETLSEEQKPSEQYFDTSVIDKQEIYKFNENQKVHSRNKMAKSSIHYEIKNVEHAAQRGSIPLLETAVLELNKAIEEFKKSIEGVQIIIP